MRWFLGKISFLVRNNKGHLKPEQETFLCRASGFNEAEKLLYQAGDGRDSLFTKTLVIQKIRETIIAPGNEGKWFEVVIGYEEENEKTGKTKLVREKIMACAPEFDDAQAIIKDAFSHTMLDWRFLQVKETKILECLNGDGTPLGIDFLPDKKEAEVLA